MSKKTQRTIALGSQGLRVSALGYGCMGLTTAYGKKMPDDDVVGMLKKVFTHGVTLWDTANVYCYPEYTRLLTLRSPLVCQEELIARALQEVGRENITVATKTGIKFSMFPRWSITPCGDPVFVRKQCEDSLRRLKVTYLDLFYLHRIDPDIPIEITMATMRDLVQEGKVRYVGLSECSANTLRRAHKVHPISCIQMEWSLWCRGIEKELLPTCAELGIGIVAYSPLGRGFFGGAVKKEGDIKTSADFRKGQARLRGDALDKNLKLLEEVEKIAKRLNATPAQLALAWLKKQESRLNGAGVVAIPGTTKEKNLLSNIGSMAIDLTDDDVKALEAAVPPEEVVGDRYDGDFGKTVFEDEKNKELSPEEAAKYYR